MIDLFGDFAAFAASAAQSLSAIGVIIIFGGAIISTLAAAFTALRTDDLHRFYKAYRHNLARSIVTGLDFLIAADLIRTAAVDLTLTSTATLGLIVVIRALITLEFEITLFGRLPWSHSRKSSSDMA